MGGELSLKYGRLLYETDAGERMRQEVRSRRNYLTAHGSIRKCGDKVVVGIESAQVIRERRTRRFSLSSLRSLPLGVSRTIGWL